MNRIENLYKEWMSLQPITSDVQNKIDQKFMLEFNYNSNHIEGNTLTYGQTELLLMFGKVDGDAKMHDLEEMKAHNVGLKMMQEEAQATDRPLTEYFIRELHRTLLREDYTVQKELPDGSITTYTVHAGQYKTRPNSVKTVTGEIFEYASPEETPALMSDLVGWYNSTVESGELSALELASLFHYRYIRIHPFEDGNGRIARLLVNFILLRAGYPMIIVRSDDKDKYLSALNRSDIAVGLTPSDGAHAEQAQIQPFVEYMKGCLERALDIRIRAAKGESIEEEDDWKKQMSLIKAKLKNAPRYSEDLAKMALIDNYSNILDNIASNIDYFIFNLTISSFNEKSIGLMENGVESQKKKIREIVESYKSVKNEEWRFSQIIYFAAITTDSTSYTISCEFKEFEYIICVYPGFAPSNILYKTKIGYGSQLADYQLTKLVNAIGKYIICEYQKCLSKLDDSQK